MSIRNVTMTSKNQITLPSEYVKNLRLTKSRVLRAELHDGRIVLTPQPALSEIMRPFWSKHKAKRPLTDTEIKQAVRTISGKRVAKG